MHFVDSDCLYGSIRFDETLENPNHCSRQSKGRLWKNYFSVAIAAGFAKLGYSVCLADTDPQCNATESFGVRAESVVEEGRFTLADAYLRKKAALDIEYDFGDRFGGTLTILPGKQGFKLCSA